MVLNCESSAAANERLRRQLKEQAEVAAALYNWIKMNVPSEDSEMQELEEIWQQVAIAEEYVDPNICRALQFHELQDFCDSFEGDPDAMNNFTL
ncbi:hypothetical protein ACHHYP_11135 [Achlya hypogyna]|uniref:Uncharacterized protein n=1 Tax=Achlya hypogyna TaxID=1202772 RepID=A0A1V9YJS0_ACHHY|nr:hypothetical protein ACHHYP_11135 [Achlya hypogyna]